MAWVAIPNNPDWEYNNDPTDPGATNATRRQWALSSNGVRQQKDGTQVYVQVRRVGDTADANRGELSKSFWDARGDEDDIETDMILVFRTTASNEQVRVGAAAHYVSGVEQDYDGSINWGDGTTTTVTGKPLNNADLVHTFASSGDHTVRVSGPGFHKVNFRPGSTSFTSGGNTEAQTDKLIRVLNLGDIGHKYLRYAFYRTRQMMSFTLGHTDLSNCDNMGGFFALRTWNMNANAVPATVDLTGLDTSGFSTGANSQQINDMFESSAINMNTLNLTGINTANLTMIRGLYKNITGNNSTVAAALNFTTIDVRPYNTSSVTNFISMFSRNSTLTTITGIEDMDVSSGEYFGEMFYGTGLTGSLDLSSWDWSSGINYSYMFNNSSSLTDIIGIENISVTALNNTSALSNFLSGVTLPTSRYDQLLINLAAQTKNQASQTAHFGNSQYTTGGAAEAARTSLINNDGYTITDGGAA
jgi:hypothetical protein